MKEIKDLLDAPERELKVALENQVIRLKGEKKQMEVLIRKAHELIENI